MNKNVELLNYIYQNSQMGVDTIHHLLTIVEEDDMIEQLKSELKEYTCINDKAKDLLNENGYDEKGIGTLEKTMTDFMITMQTIRDNSSSHIAEMMLKGSNMGIIDATKKINEYTDADEHILDLMKKLLKLEENNVDELKNFL